MHAQTKTYHQSHGTKEPRDHNGVEQMEFLFVAEDAQRQREIKRLEFEAQHRKSWMLCWGWEGPEVGKPCDINSCGVKLAEPDPEKYNGSETIYAYMERCILLEERPDGYWLAEISMGIVHGKPWYKDGTKVLLSINDIWPPTRDIRAQRESR